MSVHQISQQVYNQYGFSDAVGLEYFGRYTDMFRRYDPEEVIAYQVRNYDLRYGLDFILSSPQLWQCMNEDSWESILARSCPRPSSRLTTIHFDGYADVVFLCRFMRLDGIRLFLESSRIRDTEKGILAGQVERFAGDLVWDPLDTDDLDGDYFTTEDQIQDARAKLLSGSRLAAFDNTRDAVLKYVQRNGSEQSLRKAKGAITAG